MDCSSDSWPKVTDLSNLIQDPIPEWTQTVLFCNLLAYTLSVVSSQPLESLCTKNVWTVPGSTKYHVWDIILFLNFTILQILLVSSGANEWPCINWDLKPQGGPTWPKSLPSFSGLGPWYVDTVLFLETDHKAYRHGEPKYLNHQQLALLVLQVKMLCQLTAWTLQ